MFHPAEEANCLFTRSAVRWSVVVYRGMLRYVRGFLPKNCLTLTHYVLYCTEDTRVLEWGIFSIMNAAEKKKRYSGCDNMWLSLGRTLWFRAILIFSCAILLEKKSHRPTLWWLSEILVKLRPDVFFFLGVPRQLSSQDLHPTAMSSTQTSTLPHHAASR